MMSSIPTAATTAAHVAPQPAQAWATRTAQALACAMLYAVLAGCSLVRDDAGSGAVRHSFSLPPQRAAACFARNAEAHSSALAAEVRAPDARGHIEVIVRVKNGVLYATADIRPAGSRSDGILNLMVVSKGGTRQLVESLVDGC